MKNIVVCGDAILDKYIYGSIERQSPEDNSVPVLDISKTEIRLGGCLNAAANIKALSKDDTSVHVSTIVSEYTWMLLPTRKISKAYCHILKDYNAPSPFEIIKERIINEKTNKQIVRIDNRKMFRATDVHKYEKCFGYDIPFCDVIVISDYNKGIISSNTLETIAKHSDKPIFVDSKKTDLTIFPKNCIFKVNAKEFSQLKNWNSLATLIVTKGEDGCELYREGQLINSFSAKKVINADVTGAGDTFLAGLVVKYLETKSLEEAIEFANKVAAISVTFFGTAVITRKMVEEEI